MLDKLKRAALNFPPYLLIIPFFKPGFFDEIWPLDLAYNGLRGLAFLCALAKLFFLKKEPRSFRLLILLQAWLLVATVIGRGSIYAYVKTFFAFAVYIIVFLSLDSILDLIKTCFRISEVFICIQLISIALFPSGLYQRDFLGASSCWFLGHKNEVFFFLIVFALSAELYELFVEKTIRTKLLHLAIVISLLLTKATNALIAAIVFYALWFFVLPRERKYLSAFRLTAIVFAFCALVLLLPNNKLFNTVVVGLLHKTATFSGRTLIWDKIFALLSKRWLTGYGMLSGIQLSEMLGLEFGVNAHNVVLQYLLSGGAIALAIFLWFCINCLKPIQDKSGALAILLSAAWTSLLLFSVFEIQNNPLVFLIYSLSDNYGLLEKTDTQLPGNDICGSFARCLKMPKRRNRASGGTKQQ